MAPVITPAARLVAASLLLISVSAAPAIADAQRTTWKLAPNPQVVIEGYADTLLFTRVVGGAVLSKGIIAVADQGLLRLMYFSGTGVPIATVGRNGSGPGEFRTMLWLGECANDTISIFDPGLDRISHFGADGRYLRSEKSAPQGPVGPATLIGKVPYSLHCSRSGRRVAVGWPPPEAMRRATPGPYRTTVTVATSAGSSGPYASLGVFAGPERYRFKNSDGPRPHGKVMQVAAIGDNVFIGTADSFYVSIATAASGPIGAIKLPGMQKPFGAPEKAFDLRAITPAGASAEIRARAKAYADEMQYPEFLPAYTRFLADERGWLWIEESHAVSDSVVRWWVFSEQGIPIGNLTVPTQFSMLDVTESVALGVWTNIDDGTQTIRLYPMQKGK